MSGSVWMFSDQIDDPLHPCFIASIHYADRVQYLLDILLQGSSHEKQQLLNGK